MKKNALICLIAIFCLMLVLNIFKPLSSDDYFLAFVWPEGTGINGFLPETARRVSSFRDIYESLKSYYFVWGGRIPGQSLMTFFVWQGKSVFNVLNAFVFIILILEIYWISHEGKVGLDFNVTYIIWIFFSLWAFNISFNDTFLWLSGSCEYLWMAVILLAFMLPYVKNYFDNMLLNNNSITRTLGMLVLGILAGDSRETVICWLIVFLAYWLFICYQQNNLQYWKIAGLVGLCIGYSLLMFAPGNYSRLVLQQQSASVFIPREFLLSKVIESLEIIAFHSFLWRFILNYFYNYYKNNGWSHPNKKEKDDLYINFAAMCTSIAFGSGVIMFFIQSEGFRPSFINLIFLIIAASCLFRVAEMQENPSLNETTKFFFQKIGYLYLIFTIVCSLWGNHMNWKYWNSILALVNETNMKKSEVILEIEPYPIGKNNILTMLSGFHVSVMPFHGNNEASPVNRTFARYYGIKGIKIKS